MPHNEGAVSAYTPQLTTQCKQCGRELVPGTLACSHCLALVHQDQLEQLAAEARRLESNSQFMDARNVWLSALPLLPPDSRQAVWIRDHAHELESQAGAPQHHGNAKKWAKWLGPLAPLAVVLAKAKSLLLVIFKLPFLLSFVAFFGIYWELYGGWFGAGFAVCILIHEMGHYIDIRRRGLPADMPVFLPGLGAFVRWRALGVSLETRAEVSLAGPFAGGLAALACLLLWRQTGNGVWAALAFSGAWLNVMNLTPVWILDGGSATLALSKLDRGILLGVAVALAYTLNQPIFYVVAAGCAWRLFTRDHPEQPSRLITAYFVALLAGLGLIMWMVPRAGFGA